MRADINFISWWIFLFALIASPLEKKSENYNAELKQIRVDKVAGKKPLRQQLPLFVSDKT